MIAVDTSTWIAFFDGVAGRDTDLLDLALRDQQVLIVPVVLTELLSSPSDSKRVFAFLAKLPLIEIKPGYWYRAGELRSKVLGPEKEG